MNSAAISAHSNTLLRLTMLTFITLFLPIPLLPILAAAFIAWQWRICRIKFPSSPGAISMGRSSSSSSGTSPTWVNCLRLGLLLRSLFHTPRWREYALPWWRIFISMLIVKRPRQEAEQEECGQDPKKKRNCDHGSVLDLPELALDAILGRLPADALLRMGEVCRELRRRCRSDHLWGSLVYEKWGRLAQVGALNAWRRKQAQESNRRCSCCLDRRSPKQWLMHLACLWPISLLRRRRVKIRALPAMDSSVMAWYWALETGAFWFPAQVYNREYGHVGFLLSCYDAELSYERSTDSFRARYPPHGPRAMVMEDNIPWQRLRAPAVDTPATVLHSSDCLFELKPGDHIEVQWRRNKEFPYGWWYGVVGHSEDCNSGDCRHCSCHTDGTVWLVFHQYTSGSRWRRAAINRSSHREEGNETDGFYGGVRKLRTKDEISVWESLWPTDILE